VSLGSKSRGWHATSAPSGTSNSRSTSRLSATLSRRLWRPCATPTLLRFEEIQRRREEIGYSYFVFGADFADALAPVVAELAGH